MLVQNAQGADECRRPVTFDFNENCGFWSGKLNGKNNCEKVPWHLCNTNNINNNNIILII